MGEPDSSGCMGESTENNSETLRDVYGAIDPDDVEGREDWDPALEPEGLVPETAPDGREYHVAAWDGGVSDLDHPAPNVHDMTAGAPAVLVYLSNQGGVQVFEGELVNANDHEVKIRDERGKERTARAADMDGRQEAVEGSGGRHIGTMLDVRMTRPWAKLAEHYGLPDGVSEVFEVVAVYPDEEHVVAIEPTREEANQARRDWTPAWDDDEPRGMTVRELTDDDATIHSIKEEGNQDGDDDQDDGDGFEQGDVVAFEYDGEDVRGVVSNPPHGPEGTMTVKLPDGVNASDWTPVDPESAERVGHADDFQPYEAFAGPDVEDVLARFEDDRDEGDYGPAPSERGRDTLPDGGDGEVKQTGPHSRVVVHDDDTVEVQHEERREVGTAWTTDHTFTGGSFCLSCQAFFDHSVPVNTGHATNGESGCPGCRSAEDLRAVVLHQGDERSVTGGYIPSSRRDEAVPVDRALELAEGRPDGDDDDDDHDGGFCLDPDCEECATASLPDVEECPDCDGTGEIVTGVGLFDVKDCPTCGGSGDVEGDDPTPVTDGGKVRETPVDGGVIHDVAMSYTFGAGHLKAVLERVGPDGDLTTDSLDDEDQKTAEAARKALELHGEHEAIDLRDDLEGETFYSDEFGVPVEVSKVHDPHADDVLRGIQPINVEKPNGAIETTSLDTLVTEDADPDDLEVGDLYRLPDGTALHIQGVVPADEAPESARDGPLYQAVLRHPDESTETFLYGPHNIRQGIAGGAVYAGWASVEERTPFWCDGCEYPHLAGERRDDPLLDAEVCSYGCGERVTQEHLKEGREWSA